MFDGLRVGLRVESNAVKHVDVVAGDRGLSGVDGGGPGKRNLGGRNGQDLRGNRRVRLLASDRHP